MTNRCPRDWKECDRSYCTQAQSCAERDASAPARASLSAPAAREPEPSSKWPFEQPHVARDLLARLYATLGCVRDAKLEAEIDVFLAASRRP
jgi:hypothetical protein